MRILGSALVALIVLVLVDEGLNSGRYTQTALNLIRQVGSVSPTLANGLSACRPGPVLAVAANFNQEFDVRRS